MTTADRIVAVLVFALAVIAVVKLAHRVNIRRSRHLDLTHLDNSSPHDGTVRSPSARITNSSEKTTSSPRRMYVILATIGTV